MKKWIINDGQLYLGNVDFHKNLMHDGMNPKKTIGGGLWEVHNKKLYFYGSSHDFGCVTEEQFRASLETSRMPLSYQKIDKIFSTREEWKDVLCDLFVELTNPIFDKNEDEDSILKLNMPKDRDKK